MLDVLKEVELALPELLLRTDWNSMMIDYEQPHVLRLWRPFGADYRVYLHEIHMCPPSCAYYHPHPWPSAMRIVEGVYEMGLGYGVGETPPPQAATVVLHSGSAYEMTDPDGWHCVQPLAGNVLSVMVTGKPWGRSGPKQAPRHNRTQVSDERARQLQEAMQRYYA